MKRNPKIFIGPVEIAGYYNKLAQGFKSIDVSYDFITYHYHPFEYGGITSNPFLIRLASWLERYSYNKKSLFIRMLIISLSRLCQSIWGFFAIFRYDVFIFGFGSTLLPRNIDLPVLSFLGKKVISVMHGSDTRPSFVNGFFQSKSGVHPPTVFNLEKAKSSRKMMDAHQKYATFVIGAPFSTYPFASSRFINYLIMGFPAFGIDAEVEFVPSNYERDPSRRPIRILHSPSHPIPKGSPKIIQAIENLKQKGYLIDFVLLHGRPTSEVQSEIQACDFVVDQVYSDVPLPGFATESAWFGKPAVIAGYGLSSLKSTLPEDLWPVSKICEPNSIQDAIEELIVDVNQRIQLGIKAKAFVRDKWDSKEVALRYMSLINDDFPSEWWVNPNDYTYLEGAGQTIEETKLKVRELVTSYGIGALQLSHRPDLEKAFQVFSKA